jgi:hypothetical protein
MGEAAERFEATFESAPALRESQAVSLTLVHGGLSRSQREVLILGVILSLAQVLDGILTGIGMATYGTSMEGNALLRSLMHSVGYLPALLIVKGASIGVIAFLCSQALKVSWLKLAMRAVIAIYVVFAIVPWTFILVTEYLA